jgi:hypothetical protein
MGPIPEISKGIRIFDLTLYIEKQRSLIIPDIHIGYEEALSKQGYLVPRFHLKDLIKRMENIFMKISDAKLKTDKIILLGDVKHEFGTISDEEWRNTLKFLDFLSKHCKKIIMIKGNHDTMLGPIAKRREIEISESINMEDILICHGDKIIDVPARIKTIIIGHEHPAVTVSDGLRNETYKCFLKGRWKEKKKGRILTKKRELIVMPSLNLVTEGTDVTKESFLSPFLRQSIEDFEVYIIPSENEMIKFGKVKDVRKLSSKAK